MNYPDGRPFEGSSRHILQRAVKEAAQMGYVCKIGAECEFYLFETDEKGNPTMNPHDLGGYCDIAPNDKGEKCPAGNLPDPGGDGHPSGGLSSRAGAGAE